MKNNNIIFMKFQSIWIKAICITIIPFALFYLYKFGYNTVDKAFKVNGLKNNLDQHLIASQDINYLEIITLLLIIFLLLILMIIYKKRIN